MTLDDYQQAAARTRNPALDEREQLLDAAAGLAEEGGEALALVRKHWFQGRPLDRELAVSRAIHGVTGATLSARAATEAVRRTLALHQVLP
jgi:hypothetical protein